MSHIPVLLKEAIEHLHPQPNESFLDGTVGQGGHARAILQRTSPEGRLIAMDRDASALADAKRSLAEFGKRVVFVNDSFANAKQQAHDHEFLHVDGILLDLGFGTHQLENAGRGFSFLVDEPLDMRYDTRATVTAEMLVNGDTKEELATIFRTLGEERYANQVADAIVRARRKERITSSAQLACLVEGVIPSRGKIHPATHVFQALRIAVNDELGALERALPELVSLLAPDGRLAIITFHSLEDRIVKRFFKEQNEKTLKVVTKRPIGPSINEIKTNRRSRSAKLRVAQKYVRTDDSIHAQANDRRSD